MKKNPIRSISTIATMTAVLIFGGQAHAQNMGFATTPPSGATNSSGNVSPAPAGGKAKSADERMAARIAKSQRNAAKKAARAAKRVNVPADVPNLESPDSPQ
jgi:hypothetical protein